jgi:hypothetical protein
MLRISTDANFAMRTDDADTAATILLLAADRPRF